MTHDQHVERIAFSLAGLPDEVQCAVLIDAFAYWCQKNPEHAHKVQDPRVQQLIHEVWRRVRELEQHQQQQQGKPC